MYSILYINETDIHIYYIDGEIAKCVRLVNIEYLCSESNK